MQTGLRPIHPGEFLAEILNELEISQAAFARLIDVAPMRISHVIGGSRPMTADLALRFAKAFNQTPQYWLNLQTAHDLAVAAERLGPKLKGTRRSLDAHCFGEMRRVGLGFH